MIGIASLVLAGENLACHTYAIWGGWAFDHCGWNQESDLVAANEQYEGKSSQRIQITTDLVLPGPPPPHAARVLG